MGKNKNNSGREKRNSLSVTQIQKETNYNIISNNIDIYSDDYSFPIKTGMKFPDQKLKDRADLTLTNTLLYNNDYDRVFSSYLCGLSGVDYNTYDMQIREICASLPYFKKVVDTYRDLIMSNKPIVDIDTENNNSAYESIVNKSNLNLALCDIIKSDFIQPCSLYLVNKNKLGKDVITEIPCKNFIIYMDPEDISCVYSYVTFSIYNNSIEFIEYINNGTINKYTYTYNSGCIGKLIEKGTTQAFNGKYNEAPCVLFSNNVNRLGDIYGNDRFSTFDSAILGVIRTFNQILRLSERCREEIKIVPESALSRTPVVGGVFLNKGVITYPDNVEPDRRPTVEFKRPQLKDDIEAAIDAFNKAVSTLASATNVSKIFFDFETAGTRTLSGEALKTMLLPTTIESKQLINNKMEGIKELIHKILLLNDYDISTDNIGIDFKDGIPESLESKVDYVDKRLANKTMNLIDAIKYLDNTSTNTAINQLRSIAKMNELINNQNEPTEENESANTINEENSDVVSFSADVESSTLEDNVDSDSNVVLSPEELPFGGTDYKL
jgi:hypothetical protein